MPDALPGIKRFLRRAARVASRMRCSVYDCLYSAVARVAGNLPHAVAPGGAGPVADPGPAAPPGVVGTASPAGQAGGV